MEKVSVAKDSFDLIIGNKIKNYRIKRYYSQKDLAQAIDVSTQQVQKYEKAENRISASRLRKVAKFLNINIVNFFEETSDSGEIAKDSKNNNIDLLKNIAYQESSDGVKKFALSEKKLNFDYNNEKELISDKLNTELGNSDLRLINFFNNIKDERIKQYILYIVKYISKTNQ